MSDFNMMLSKAYGSMEGDSIVPERCNSEDVVEAIQRVDSDAIEPFRYPLHNCRYHSSDQKSKLSLSIQMVKLDKIYSSIKRPYANINESDIYNRAIDIGNKPYVSFDIIDVDDYVKVFEWLYTRVVKLQCIFVEITSDCLKINTQLVASRFSDSVHFVSFMKVLVYYHMCMGIRFSDKDSYELEPIEEMYKKFENKVPVEDRTMSLHINNKSVWSSDTPVAYSDFYDALCYNPGRGKGNSAFIEILGVKCYERNLGRLYLDLSNYLMCDVPFLTTSSEDEIIDFCEDNERDFFYYES